MKKLITILAALAVSVSFASAADEAKKAEKKAGGGEERFKKLDTNGDGFISLDELKASPAGAKDPAKAEAMLKAKDKDGDGKLSAEEFNAGGGKKGDAPKGEPKKGDAKKGEGTTKTEPAKPGSPDTAKPAGPEGAK